MRTRIFASVVTLVLTGMTLAACGPAVLPDSPPAETPADEGAGPKTVAGSVAYTNPFFTMGVAQPVIILEDQGGFVARDRDFIMPVESQVLAQITSDFYSSPFTYSLVLPAEPKGTLHDVDNDDQDDAGVMIFAVAYWTNTWGDPYLERRDLYGGGWSSAYASTRVSLDSDTYLEVFGGKFLVFAPDAEQQFPSGFGADRKLFTEDDPIMDLPAGWSVIDMDQTPFVIDRSDTVTVDLYEPESIALDDFSGMTYVEAFDAMLDKFRREYAFTEYKDVDWDARADEFRPRFEAAEKSGDFHAYVLALRDFLWSIPDTHVGMDTSPLNDDFFADIAGGIGLALGETSDGAVIARFVTPGGPAERAGIEFGAEILAMDGKPIDDVVSSVVPWSSPFSNLEAKRLQQLRYATRFRLEKGQVDVAFANPDGGESTVTLSVVQESQSFSATSFYAGQPATSLPVEYEVLPGGYGYIKINSFSDNAVLTIQIWEHALQYFIQEETPGIVLDMRHNGGGDGWLADQMAAYFFNGERVVGKSSRYDEATGEFYLDPDGDAIMIPPREALQYNGSVVVLVGPACVSACEFFSYAMTLDDRSVVVGQYPTSGAGGSVEQFVMPEGIYAQMTIGRAMDADGNIHIEGIGVLPDVRVPVNVDTWRRELAGEDVILDAAIKVLGEPKGAGIAPSAPPKVASAGEAESALSSGANFLEDLAREQYTEADYAVPGVLTYTVALNRSETLIWGYAWCAQDTPTLDQNFSQIELKFNLSGREIPTEQFATFDVASGGLQCRLIYAALSEWKGGEHRLSTTAVFKSAVDDGSAEYEAGNYIYEYAVYVKP